MKILTEVEYHDGYRDVQEYYSSLCTKASVQLVPPTCLDNLLQLTPAVSLAYQIIKD